MSQRVTIEELAQWLKVRDDIALMGHLSPDGDAVGSVLGMWHLLRAAFHETPVQITAMLPDGVPMDLDWLPGAEHILSGKTQYDACSKATAEADLVVLLDLNTVERTGVLAESL